MDGRPSPEQRLQQYRQALEEEDADLGQLPPDNGEHVGRSPDDVVAVTVAAGRVTAVALRPSPAQVAVSELERHLALAANDALARARAVAPTAEDPVPDLDALVGRLAEVGEQSSAFLRRVGTAVDEVITKVGQRTGMHGDPSPTGVDALFAEAAEVLRTARDSLGGLTGAQVTATGSDEDHEVWVTFGTNGTVSTVELSHAVPGMTNRQFNDRARQALDNALKDWTAQRRANPPGPSTADLGRLTAQAESLRTQSMDQLRGYTTKLRSIMGSIGEP
ncbi:hypothetical protein [Saccharothrix variisporea]|uniref:YbaB/EbfC DNA-binding family protein n=1 Tax=Saccharothrix variisporea TaxID=543527 RepID=A0A495X0U9_9PSEU|nr:hypothetical protein [Saccharothrix variisporea]RKT67761.1 hypothetical protein DFJ66_0937 [Saccharothrix variisporea]